MYKSYYQLGSGQLECTLYRKAACWKNYQSPSFDWYILYYISKIAGDEIGIKLIGNL